MLRIKSALMFVCVSLCVAAHAQPAAQPDSRLVSRSGMAYPTTGMFINAPGTGTVIANPVHVNAMALDPSGITQTKVYVDSKLVLFQYSTNYVDVDIPVAMTPPGTHSLCVQSLNGKGIWTKTFQTIQTVNAPTVTYPQVTLLTALNGSTVPTPLHIDATVAGTTVATNSMQVYLDNVLMTTMNKTASVDLSYDDLVVTPGPHSLMIKAIQSNGTTLTATSAVTVSGVNPPPQASVPAANLWANIQDLKTNWGTCNSNACSGSNLMSTVTSYQKFGQTSPSLTGGSMIFNVAQTDLANVLWWRNLGVDNTATQFTMDLESYLADSTLPQALEFDMNQIVQDPASKVWHHEVWGTQCDMKNGFFDVWAGDAKTQLWFTTPIACTPQLWQSGVWHRYFYQFERLPSFQMHFRFFTFDSVTYKVDVVGSPRVATSNGNSVVAIQVDGRVAPSNISEWVDAVSVTHQ